MKKLSELAENQTTFSLQSFLDLYGDKKSNRKRFNRVNYYSTLPLAEVKKIMKWYNDIYLAPFNYYSEKRVENADGRVKKYISFDDSHFPRIYKIGKAGYPDYENGIYVGKDSAERKFLQELRLVIPG